MDGVHARIRCPALVVGPGDLPMVQAQSMLLEKISAANSARARSSSAAGESWRGPRASITRQCVFPGQDPSIGPRHVVLLEGTHGVRMSAQELGSMLASHLNTQLDDERLRQLIVKLAKRADGA